MPPDSFTGSILGGRAGSHAENEESFCLDSGKLLIINACLDLVMLTEIKSN